MQIDVCPGCGHEEYAIVGNPGLAFDVQEGNNIYRQPDYRIRRCLECDLYYKSNILDERELDAYYHEVDFQKWDIGRLFPSERAVLEILSSLEPKSKILDYGCSTGRLLSTLTNQYECYGVELNEKAAEIAKKKGITILSEEALESPDQKFDAIVLSDVFEHLPEPTKVLAKLCDSLNEKGLLVLCTGNADARACRKDIANFWYFLTPEHLCMLSRKHAEYLAVRLNLKLLIWKEVTHYDASWIEKLRQHMQTFAYWQFQDDKDSLLSSFFRFIPVIKRAEYWKLPPPFLCTNDHVVVALLK